MDNSATNEPQSGKQSNSRLSPEHLDSLRERLKGFAVLDPQGQPIGQVEDLLIEAGQRPDLLISYPETQQQRRSVLLSGKLIQKINAQARSVLVSITQADVSYLPTYHPAQNGSGVSPNGLAEVPPVSQLPTAPDVIPESATTSEPVELQNGSSDQYLLGYPVKPKPAQLVEPSIETERSLDSEPVTSVEDSPPLSTTSEVSGQNAFSMSATDASSLFEPEDISEATEPSAEPLPEVNPATPELDFTPSETSGQVLPIDTYDAVPRSLESAANELEPVSLPPIASPEPVELPDFSEPPSSSTEAPELPTVQSPLPTESPVRVSGTNPMSESEGALEEVSATIPLLEEKLNIEFKRRKIGEVIVRKKIETRIVQVPVRYEKLIVEQISPEHKELAAVDLSEGEIPGVELALKGQSAISAEFRSPRAASQVLDAIAKTLHHRCKKIRLEIELEDEQLREVYQEWLNQYSQQ